VLFFGGVSLARKGIAPASIVVFAPSIASMILGAYLYKKLDWQS